MAISALEQHLIRNRILPESRLPEVRAEAEKIGAPLLEAIEKSGLATAEELYTSLADFCEMRFVRPADIPIDPRLAKEVPARFATHYNFVPLELQDDALRIAISDPMNTQLIDDIRLVLKRRVVAVVSTPGEITRRTKELYGLGADTVERILGDSGDGFGETALDKSPMAEDLDDDTIDASIIKFVNEVLMEAIQTGATDVHIEPFEDELRVRYRIDGVLHAVPTPPSIHGFQSAIVSRVKVMANLNIAEKRLPQDGKIQASLADGKYDLRVSVLPTPHGETLNIRILTRSSVFMSMEDLGFLPSDREQIDRFLAKPHGIILLTGPTGSGKTTTLYAALSKLNLLDRKTLTIEDPIEYQLHGITQMQVLPKIGFTFATGLRSMLRHDPDIMMVGEIRDYETAEMSIRASLTGHLVFSTLHTNDAAGTVTRLVDMGVEPFLIASTMIASIAQRLVRKVCDNCAEPFSPSPEALEELRVSPEEAKEATFRQGKGCDLCRQTGYKGRLAICEILPFTQPIKELCVRGATSGEIKQRGRELGMSTLRDAGWIRVKSGITTVEEVLRVTADTDLVYE